MKRRKQTPKKPKPVSPPDRDGMVGLLGHVLDDAGRVKAMFAVEQEITGGWYLARIYSIGFATGHMLLLDVGDLANRNAYRLYADADTWHEEFQRIEESFKPAEPPQQPQQ